MCNLRHLRQAFPEVISLTVILVLAVAVVLPVALLSGARPALAAAPVVSIQRVSLSSGGSEGNGSDCGGANISADGRYVAFGSSATNLVPGDTNGVLDGFVHDRQTGQTARVSLSWDGSEGNDESYGPSISADGRYVAFGSLATNLVPGDTNGALDVFVHDRQTGETARVSLSSGGTEGNDSSIKLGISADGRYVAFMSDATNLVPDDTNAASDIFVHDRQTGETARVSLSSGGTEGNGHCWDASISADGRYVAFDSGSTNLVPGDTNGVVDVFVHDRQTGKTVRVSLSWDGSEGDDGSGNPRISADGRYVAFWSDATNLVPDDTNGFPDIFVQDWAEVAVTPSAGGLPGGVIAGIVIGAVAVVGAVAFFWFRRPKKTPPVS